MMKPHAAVLLGALAALSCGEASAQLKLVPSRLRALPAAPGASLPRPQLPAPTAPPSVRLPALRVPAAAAPTPLEVPRADPPASLAAAAAGFEALGEDIKKLAASPEAAAGLGGQLEAVLTGRPAPPPLWTGRTLVPSKIVPRHEAPPLIPGEREVPLYVPAFEPGQGTLSYLAGAGGGAAASLVPGLPLALAGGLGAGALAAARGPDRLSLLRGRVWAPLAMGALGLLGGHFAGLAFGGAGPAAVFGFVVTGALAQLLTGPHFEHPDSVVRHAPKELVIRPRRGRLPWWSRGG